MFHKQNQYLRMIAYLSAFTFSGVQALMIALYPVLAWTLHLDISVLIMCFSFGSFLFLFGSPYWSNKSERLGRHKVLTIGTAALFVSFASILFLVNTALQNTILTVLLLIAGRIVYGLVASATIPAAQAIQADLAGEAGAVRAMMLHSMSISLGRVAGFALIVLFHEYFKNVLFAYFFLVAGVFLLNFFSREWDVPLKSQSQSVSGSSWKHEAFSIRWIIVIAFLFTCFIEALYSSLAGTIKNLFHMDTISASGISAEILLIMSIGVFLVQSTGKNFVKESSKTGLLVGVITLILGSILFINSGSILSLWFAIGFLIIGMGLMPPLYLSILRMGSASTQYGKRAGIIASAHTLGYAAGGGMSALIFKIGDIQIGFALTVLAICLGLACLKQSVHMNRICAQEIL